MVNLLKRIYLSNREEQNYSPVSLSSVCETETVKLMGEKVALISKIVYCPQVADYGFTVLVNIVTHWLPSAMMANILKFLAQCLRIIWEIPHDFLPTLNLISMRY